MQNTSPFCHDAKSKIRRSQMDRKNQGRLVYQFTLYSESSYYDILFRWVDSTVPGDDRFAVAARSGTTRGG